MPGECLEASDSRFFFFSGTFPGQEQVYPNSHSSLTFCVEKRLGNRERIGGKLGKRERRRGRRKSEGKVRGGGGGGGRTV